MKTEIPLISTALCAKSFYLLGNSLNHCYDCLYCRLNGEKNIEMNFNTLPSEINPIFLNIPVAINLFYGDPLMQVDNTIKYLHALESIGHKGPVIIITKGDFSKFDDIKFNLDLHFAFSTFGTNSKYDGGSMERFKNNLEQIKKRKNNYHYSIEFRPITYGINDSYEVFKEVISLAKLHNLCIGYSGLQGKPESVKIWGKEGVDLKPYPGYDFGHKKIISDEVQNLFENTAQEFNVPVFRKTSCLLSYVHNLERDYNAHYYRPSEVGCNSCLMHDKCFSYKKSLKDNKKLSELIPFVHEVIEKQDHECILKKNGTCNFPTYECSHISGSIIKINQKITTSDVRVIKWLTGMTVDADFLESPYISESWLAK